MLDRQESRDSRLTLLALLLALAVLATGCVTSIEPRSVPTGASPDPTATPAPVEFASSEQSRNDELDHDARLEWWYYSGHLESETGREFGFHFVVFKAVDGTGEPNLIAQLGLLDAETGEHFEFSRVGAGFRGSIGGNAPLTIAIADWTHTVTSTAGSHSFAATNGPEAGLSLQLEAAAPVMLHNEIGWLPTETGATYYYSWPRQSATGELVIDGQRTEVTGTVWFDHQWGDFFVLGKPAGWQWFAVQLADGASLMITEARGVNGDVVDTYGTYMSPNGDVKSLQGDADGIRVSSTGQWTSPSTGAAYPSGWTLEVSSLELELKLDPVALDQEIQSGLPVGSAYWEGKVRVSGSQGGRPVSGNAYVELSGYADPEPIEWLGR